MRQGRRRKWAKPLVRLRQATAQENWRFSGDRQPEKLPNHPLSQGPCNDAYTAESVMTKVKAPKET